MPDRTVDQEFVQERLYIELDYCVNPEQIEKLRERQDKDDDDRGVIVIDIL